MDKLEEKSYINEPGTFEESQIETWNIILEITEDDHYKSWNLLHWCGMYFDARGDHCSIKSCSVVLLASF